MKKSICLLMVLIAGLESFSQTSSPSFADSVVYSEPDLVTKIFGKDKGALFDEFLQISPVEQKAFTAAFLEYEDEKRPWLTERIALLKMYNEEFTCLDEKKMNSLTKQLINNDLEFGRLQMRYFRRMNKLLGATRAAKFFQMDNYLEQSSRAYLQNDLPFIRALESDRQFSSAKPVTSGKPGIY
ncbi:hypothetical protein [Chitinophaga sp. HK235]|uniref:hypothetical protein n=1 Tax=Chitinophaga sp. HK235 TaxID=2952571 RepID=UPI001BA8AEF2|nr:hypothetical protein [Chitinophaga sp. HK235]